MRLGARHSRTWDALCASCTLQLSPANHVHNVHDLVGEHLALLAADLRKESRADDVIHYTLKVTEDTLYALHAVLPQVSELSVPQCPCVLSYIGGAISGR